MSGSKKISYDLLDESLQNILKGLETPSPYEHVHDDRYFTETEMNTLLAAKASTDHNHNTAYYTKTEIGTLLELRAPVDHTHDYAAIEHAHDMLYYSKTIVDNKLLNKAEAVHVHDNSYYTKSQVDSALNGKAAATHTHTEFNTITSLDQRLTAVEQSGDASHVHSNMDALNLITSAELTNWNNAFTHVSNTSMHLTSEKEALWNTVSDKAAATHDHADTYAATTHTHDDRYYTEGEVNTKLQFKAETVHLHTVAQITDFPHIVLGTTQPSTGYWFKEVS